MSACGLNRALVAIFASLLPRVSPCTFVFRPDGLRWRAMKTGWMLIALLGLAGCATAENWPCFRGPTRQGESRETGLPLRWNASENVAWKTPIPGDAWSSPIVWGDRVFLTTATENGASCRVLSLDRRTGAVLWNKEVFRQTPGHRNNRNSYATPTPCTDGERVYAVFGDGSFAALDFGGKIL